MWKYKVSGPKRKRCFLILSKKIIATNEVPNLFEIAVK